MPNWLRRLTPELVAEAFSFVDVKTKRELVDLALREFVEHRKRKDMRDLRGKIHLADDYDYKSLRAGK